jgi:hypothetical protein
MNARRIPSMAAWRQFDFDSAHMEEPCAPSGEVSLSDLLIKGAELEFSVGERKAKDGDTLRETWIWDASALVVVDAQVGCVRERVEQMFQPCLLLRSEQNPHIAAPGMQLQSSAIGCPRFHRFFVLVHCWYFGNRHAHVRHLLLRHGRSGTGGRAP